MNVNDFEPEYSMVIPGGVILIEKNGGGTVGKKYMGELWSYMIIVHGEVIAKGNDLYCGMPTSHKKAAKVALDFFEEGVL